MLCISISDSPVLTSALAGITKHGIWSKHFTFWIKVLFNFIDVNLSINLMWWRTTLVVCGYGPGGQCDGSEDPSPTGRPAFHRGTGMSPKFCTTAPCRLTPVSRIPITKWHALPETRLNVGYEWKAFLKRMCYETENRGPPQCCA